MDLEKIIIDEVKKLTKHIDLLSRNPNGATEFKDKLDSNLLYYYEADAKLIYLYELLKTLSIKYEEHLITCDFSEQPEKCSTNRFYIKCKFFAEQEIRTLNPFTEYSILRPNINSDLLKANLLELKEYPDAAKLYQSALDKLNESRYERNLLDDLRLCLEIIIKKKLNNNKSIENQNENLGEYLKEKGISKELTNMLIKLLDYFTKYHNTYIKHNDHVKEKEIDFTINLTAAFINIILMK